MITWVAFFWCVLRYWQTHKEDFKKSFPNEFNEWQAKPYINNYVNKRMNNTPFDVQGEGYHVQSLYWSGWCVTACFRYFKSVSRNHKGLAASIVNHDDKTLPNVEFAKLTDFTGWILASRATAECIIQYPTFSSYIVPYILAFLAVIGPLFH